MVWAISSKAGMSIGRFIDETGIASSTMMGQLRNIETQQDLFYPSAWHAGAWVLSDVGNLTIVEATNLTGIVLSGLLLPTVLLLTLLTPLLALLQKLSY